VSQERQTLYDHCVRALNRSLQTGAHGLPLIGSGDWNDGMNRVGAEGKGESVWLAWFLYANLENFAALKMDGVSTEMISRWKAHANSLVAAIEKNAWDGQWYRRAFYDDGTPIGSSTSDECKIDSLAQTWAVLSGAGSKDRAKIAMNSVYEHLVKPDHEIILLLTPPFDQTLKDPGYIKGYVPGVRENGGQYTHAGAWVVMATALLGDGKKAYELFSFLNPIHHTGHSSRANRYKLEPYAVAGDVYSEEPNLGRGGWSWYTGAAGWLYRCGIEYILGLQISGDQVSIRPCVPPEWKHFRIRYQYHDSDYIFDIEIDDHVTVQEQKLTLVADGKNHEVFLRFGAAKQPTLENNEMEAPKAGLSEA
jgi:cyclic beta-1,2-glucan synthetase